MVGLLMETLPTDSPNTIEAGGNMFVARDELLRMRYIPYLISRFHDTVPQLPDIITIVSNNDRTPHQ